MRITRASSILLPLALAGAAFLAAVGLADTGEIPTYAASPPPVGTVVLDGLWKDEAASSRYVITNQGTLTATLVHTFYNTAGISVAVITDPLPGGAAKMYSLGDIPTIPVGYRGSVTVTADGPITGAVVPFPLYLPLVMRAYRPPPPPPVYPDDPYFSYQWAMTKIRAPEAWPLSKGQGILIAVLDTGTDYTHPDLAGKVRTDIDYDFVNGDADALDDNGHGTHVSGIAAAATDNGIGVAGLGWDATLLPLKVMNAQGEGSGGDLIAAIYDAADKGARVINMSLGGDASCFSTLQAAVDYAYSRGVLLVAAAGNSGIYQTVFPANCNHVLGVAATTSSDSRASFSTYGPHVSVAAPGVEILSTCRGGSYCWMDGTSMATPFVAGLAALVYGRYPTYTPDQAASAILDNAVDLGSAGWDQYTGCGRIDAFAALWEGARGNSPLCLGSRVWSTPGGRKPQAFIPGEVVVTLRAGARVEALLRKAGATWGLPLYVARSGVQVWRLRVPLGQEPAVLARLWADPAVIAADRNYPIESR